MPITETLCRSTELLRASNSGFWCCHFFSDSLPHAVGANLIRRYPAWSNFSSQHHEMLLHFGPTDGISGLRGGGGGGRSVTQKSCSENGKKTYSRGGKVWYTRTWLSGPWMTQPCCEVIFGWPHDGKTERLSSSTHPY